MDILEDPTTYEETFYGESERFKQEASRLTGECNTYDTAAIVYAILSLRATVMDLSREIANLRSTP